VACGWAEPIPCQPERPATFDDRFFGALTRFASHLARQYFRSGNLIGAMFRGKIKQETGVIAPESGHLLQQAIS